MRFKERPHPWLVGIVFLTGLILFTGAAAAGANVKLNGVLPGLGDVAMFAISPDGRYAVYQADQNTDGVTDIFSVLLDGGLPVRLNPLLPAGKRIGFTSISPDSSRVVYIAVQDQLGVDELYSVPIVSPTGYNQWVEGAPIFWKKLNRPLTAEGDVKSFTISPDSSRVVYLADQERDTVIEVYRVPLMGPTTLGVKIGPLLVGGVVKPAPFDAVKITPDSRRVVYRANQQAINVFELYSTPTEGPASAGIKLNGPLTANGSVKDFFGISPDSGRVLYIADQDTDEISELYLTSNYWLHLPLITKMNY